MIHFHTTKVPPVTKEEMLRIYDQMLTALAYTDGDMSYTGPCEHCGEDQLWQPYSTQTTLTTGHYYLCSIRNQNIRSWNSSADQIMIFLKKYGNI